MNWNRNAIRKNAGIVWEVLNDNEMLWEELLESTGLSPLELASAIGWLARENKVNVHFNRDETYFSIYHENYF